MLRVAGLPIDDGRKGPGLWRRCSLVLISRFPRDEDESREKVELIGELWVKGRCIRAGIFAMPCNV